MSLLRFGLSKLLREHVNKAHRRARREEMEDLEAANMRSAGCYFGWHTKY